MIQSAALVDETKKIPEFFILPVTSESGCSECREEINGKINLLCTRNNQIKNVDANASVQVPPLRFHAFCTSAPCP